MVKDVLLDDSGDLQISNGDFVVGESDEQHIMLLVNYHVGALKKFPLTGVGIMDYSGSSGLAAQLRNSIKINAESDGYSNISVTLEQDSTGVFDYDVKASRT